MNIKIVEELKRYVRPLGELQIYKDIITGIFQARTRDQKEFREQLKFKLEVSHRRMSKARDLLLDGKIEADDYRIIKIECEKAIRRLEAKSTATAGQKLDIKNLLNNALKNLSKLDVLYESGATFQKRNIIGSMFPEKLTFDGLHFRTIRVNEAVALTSLIYKKIRGQKKRDKSKKYQFVPFGTRGGT